MDTERGLFELKYFFHSSLASYGGEMLSSLTIKIARRTVTKYRRELKLPPANRRQYRGRAQSCLESESCM
jgi:DNA-directed RNA polymerase specialized sigma54-like protein